ncbi:hypothetical protein ABZX90_38405 [Streptomyces sp. NPDC002935]|uniref:hypothetical protein n=1 Tax=Streptomyces sp. NPDC002935 TaxID=3154545 RepID=UPI0033A44F89
MARVTSRYIRAHAVAWSVIAVLPLLAGPWLATRVAGGLTVGFLLLALLGLGIPLTSRWFDHATRRITEQAAPAGDTDPFTLGGHT